MWRRNESAATVKCSSSPRRPHAAPRISRTNTSCRVSVGVKAVKSWPPTSAAAHSSSCVRSRAAATRARDAHEALHASVSRAPRTGTTVPSPRSGRGSRRAPPPPRAPPRRPAAPCSAPRRAAPTGGPPSPSRLATCPVAWTPASVRPATARLAPRRQHGVERLAQHAFDRPLTGLPRPPAKPGPVVLERQPQACDASNTGRERAPREALRTCAWKASRRARDRRRALTVTSARTGGTFSPARASQISPSSCTCPRGDSARTTTAVRPTSVSAPTVARRRFDQRAKNADLDHVYRRSAGDRDDAPRRGQDRERQDHRDDGEHGRRLVAPTQVSD